METFNVEEMRVRPLIKQIPRFVDPHELDAFFGLVFDYYAKIYGHPKNLSRQDYVNAMRLIFTERIAYVNSMVTGAGIYHSPSLIHLPKIIADVINSYGVITVFNGSTIVVPEATEPYKKIEEYNNLHAKFWHHLYTFHCGSEDHSKRLRMPLDVTKKDLEGTAAYAISIFSEDFGRTMAEGCAPVIDEKSTFGYPKSCFPEVEPNDVLLAAIAMNGYNGNLFGNDDWPFVTPPLGNIKGIRIAYLNKKSAL